MFGFSFGELLVIALVAVLVLGPEDLPKAVRTASKAWRSVQLMLRDLRTQLDQAIGQEELAELRQLRESLKGKTGFIRDINGHWRETFDTANLMQPKKPATPAEPPPAAAPPLVETDGTPLEGAPHG